MPIICFWGIMDMRMTNHCWFKSCNCRPLIKSVHVYIGLHFIVFTVVLSILFVDFKYLILQLYRLAIMIITYLTVHNNTLLCFYCGLFYLLFYCCLYGAVLIITCVIMIAPNKFFSNQIKSKIVIFSTQDVQFLFLEMSAVVNICL
jgi:hypothetical protein